MNRRRSLALVAALGAPRLAWAQPARKLPRIGILFLASTASTATSVATFRSALRDFGHIDGRTVEIDLRSAEGRAERLPELAAQLVARPVDVLLTGGGNVSTFAAKKATATIPIVMTGGFEVVEAGIVASLARPGGNVTGVSVPQELAAKQFEFLRELVPNLSRIAILLRRDAAAEARLARGKSMAQEFLRLTVEYALIDEAEDLARAFTTIRTQKPGALIVGPDPLFFQHKERIIEFARAARLPTIYPFRDFVDAGGMLSYSLSAKEVHKTVARYVDRILKGAKPADPPVEEPREYELVINAQTVKAAGITVPPSLLAWADEVLQ
jgi:putative ABC transport system substrate-binding protein